MAAIANDSGLDLNVVSKGLQSKLPPYARPVFIRLLEKVDTTGKYRISVNIHVGSFINHIKGSCLVCLINTFVQLTLS